MLEEVIEYIQYNGENIVALQILGAGRVYAKSSDYSLKISDARWYFIVDKTDIQQDRLINIGDFIVRDSNGVHLMTASEFQQKYGEVE